MKHGQSFEIIYIRYPLQRKLKGHLTHIVQLDGAGTSSTNISKQSSLQHGSLSLSLTNLARQCDQIAAYKDSDNEGDSGVQGNRYPVTISM